MAGAAVAAAVVVVAISTVVCLVEERSAPSRLLRAGFLAIQLDRCARLRRARDIDP